MPEHSSTPSIEVRIGRQTRLYYAFITSAPADLDAPSTMTLHAATLADVTGLAAAPISLDAGRARNPGRLVLVDVTELGWQQARVRQVPHLFAPADPGLVGLNTLQKWLWQRLQTPHDEIAQSLANGSNQHPSPATSAGSQRR